MLKHVGFYLPNSRYKIGHNPPHSSFYRFMTPSHIDIKSAFYIEKKRLAEKKLVDQQRIEGRPPHRCLHIGVPRVFFTMEGFHRGWIRNFLKRGQGRDSGDKSLQLDPGVKPWQRVWGLWTKPPINWSGFRGGKPAPPPDWPRTDAVNSGTPDIHNNDDIIAIFISSTRLAKTSTYDCIHHSCTSLTAYRNILKAVAH